MPKDIRDEIAGGHGQDEGQSNTPPSVDEDFVISEGDISDGSLPEEITQAIDPGATDGTGPPTLPFLLTCCRTVSREDESDEEEVVEPAVTSDVNIDLPILGYGENNERIFCFSKIFTNGGVKYFLDEQRREAEQNERKARQMAERLRRNLERQLPRPQPVDALTAWLADPETTSESDSEMSHVSEKHAEMENGGQDDVTLSHPSSRSGERSHLIDQKHFLKGNRDRWEDRIAVNEAEGRRMWKMCEREWKSLGEETGRVMNLHILGNDWLDHDQMSTSSPRLIWDLNDPHMRFRLQDTSTEVDLTNAVATILPPAEKVSSLYVTLFQCGCSEKAHHWSDGMADRCVQRIGVL